MCCVGSEHESIAKQRLKLPGIREHDAIRVVTESEAAFAHLFFESRGDFAQRGRVDLIKSPAGGAQLVNRVEKTIRIPSDGFCDGQCFITAAFAHELFGGDGEKETKMLAQRHLQVTVVTQ